MAAGPGGVVVAAFFGLAVASAAAAQGPSSQATAPPGVKDECADDARKLCQQVRGGWNPVHDCLREHAAQASRACKRYLAANEPAFRDCHDDVDRFCSDIFPVGGRVFECLRSHQDELTNACQARVTAAFEATEKIQQACSDDVRHLCSDVRPGAGRLARCLREHESQLSKKCRSSVGE